MARKILSILSYFLLGFLSLIDLHTGRGDKYIYIFTEDYTKNFSLYVEMSPRRNVVNSIRLARA